MNRSKLRASLFFEYQTQNAFLIQVYPKLCVERNKAICCHLLHRPLSGDISILISLIGDFLTLFQYLHLCEESLERSVGLLGLEASVEEEGVLVGPP
jgi:hypothetical protein